MPCVYVFMPCESLETQEQASSSTFPLTKQSFLSPDSHSERGREEWGRRERRQVGVMKEKMGGGDNRTNNSNNNKTRA